MRDHRADQRHDFTRPAKRPPPAVGFRLRRGVVETTFDIDDEDLRTCTVRIWAPGPDWDAGDDTDDVWVETDERAYKCRPILPVQTLEIGTKVAVADIGGRNVILLAEC